MMDQKLSRNYNHVILLWFPDRTNLDEYMRVHARMVKDRLEPVMVEAPAKGGSFLAEIDVPEEKTRIQTWNSFGSKL
jgi:hypothetical protein